MRNTRSKGQPQQSKEDKKKTKKGKAQQKEETKKADYIARMKKQVNEANETLQARGTRRGEGQHIADKMFQVMNHRLVKGTSKSDAVMLQPSKFVLALIRGDLQDQIKSREYNKGLRDLLQTSVLGAIASKTMKANDAIVSVKTVLSKKDIEQKVKNFATQILHRLQQHSANVDVYMGPTVTVSFLLQIEQDKGTRVIWSQAITLETGSSLQQVSEKLRKVEDYEGDSNYTDVRSVRILNMKFESVTSFKRGDLTLTHERIVASQIGSARQSMQFLGVRGGDDAKRKSDQAVQEELLRQVRTQTNEKRKRSIFALGGYNPSKRRLKFMQCSVLGFLMRNTTFVIDERLEHVPCIFHSFMAADYLFVHRMSMRQQSSEGIMSKSGKRINEPIVEESQKIFNYSQWCTMVSSKWYTLRALAAIERADDGVVPSKEDSFFIQFEQSCMQGNLLSAFDLYMGLKSFKFPVMIADCYHRSQSHQRIIETIMDRSKTFRRELEELLKNIENGYAPFLSARIENGGDRRGVQHLRESLQKDIKFVERTTLEKSKSARDLELTRHFAVVLAYFQHHLYVMSFEQWSQFNKEMSEHIGSSEKIHKKALPPFMAVSHFTMYREKVSAFIKLADSIVSNGSPRGEVTKKLYEDLISLDRDPPGGVLGTEFELIDQIKDKCSGKDRDKAIEAMNQFKNIRSIQYKMKGRTVESQEKKFAKYAICGIDIETLVDNENPNLNGNFKPYCVSIVGSLWCSTEKGMIPSGWESNDNLYMDNNIKETFWGLDCIDQFIDFLTLRGCFYRSQSIMTSDIVRPTGKMFTSHTLVKGESRAAYNKIHNVFCAHNGFGFDYRFMIEKIFSRIGRMEVKGSIRQAKMLYGYGLKFLDTSLIIPGSLRSIACSMFTKNAPHLLKFSNEDIKEMDMERYRKLREHEGDVINQIMEYCEQDARVVREIGSTFFRRVFTTPFNHQFVRQPFFHSGANLAYHVFKNCYMEKKLGVNPHAYQSERSSYRGGLTQTIRTTLCFGAAADVNSSYPAAATNLIPFEYEQGFHSQEVIETYHISSTVSSNESKNTANGTYDFMQDPIIEMINQEDDLHMHFEPWLVLNFIVPYNLYYCVFEFPIDCVHPTISIRAGDSLVNPLNSNDQFVWVWGIELIQGIQQRQMRVFITKHIKYTPLYSHKKFMEDMYTKRCMSKREGDEVEQLMYKLLMNSEYGIHGMKQFKQNFVGSRFDVIDRIFQLQQSSTVCDNFDVRPLVAEDVQLYELTYNVQGDEVSGKGSTVRIASYITALARVNLNDMIFYIEKEFGADAVCYMDTDSVYFDITRVITTRLSESQRKTFHEQVSQRLTSHQENAEIAKHRILELCDYYCTEVVRQEKLSSRMDRFIQTTKRGSIGNTFLPMCSHKCIHGIHQYCKGYIRGASKTRYLIEQPECSKQTELLFSADNIGAYKLERYVGDAIFIGSKQYCLYSMSDDSPKVEPYVKLKGVGKDDRNIDIILELQRGLDYHHFLIEPNAYTDVESIRKNDYESCCSRMVRSRMNMRRYDGGVGIQALLKIIQPTLFKRKYLLERDISFPYRDEKEYLQCREMKIRLLQMDKETFKREKSSIYEKFRKESNQAGMQHVRDMQSGMNEINKLSSIVLESIRYTIDQDITLETFLYHNDISKGDIAFINRAVVQGSRFIYLRMTQSIKFLFDAVVQCNSKYTDQQLNKFLVFGYVKAKQFINGLRLHTKAKYGAASFTKQNTGMGNVYQQFKKSQFELSDYNHQIIRTQHSVGGQFDLGGFRIESDEQYLLYVSIVYVVRLCWRSYSLYLLDYQRNQREQSQTKHTRTVQFHLPQLSQEIQEVFEILDDISLLCSPDRSMSVQELMQSIVTIVGSGVIEEEEEYHYEFQQLKNTQSSYQQFSKKCQLEHKSLLSFWWGKMSMLNSGWRTMFTDFRGIFNEEEEVVQTNIARQITLSSLLKHSKISNEGKLLKEYRKQLQGVIQASQSSQDILARECGSKLFQENNDKRGFMRDIMRSGYHLSELFKYYSEVNAIGQFDKIQFVDYLMKVYQIYDCDCRIRQSDKQEMINALVKGGTEDLYPSVQVLTYFMRFLRTLDLYGAMHNVFGNTQQQFTNQCVLWSQFKDNKGAVRLLVFLFGIMFGNLKPSSLNEQRSVMRSLTIDEYQTDEEDDEADVLLQRSIEQFQLEQEKFAKRGLLNDALKNNVKLFKLFEYRIQMKGHVCGSKTCRDCVDLIIVEAWTEFLVEASFEKFKLQFSFDILMKNFINQMSINEKGHFASYVSTIIKTNKKAVGDNPARYSCYTKQYLCDSKIYLPGDTVLCNILGEVFERMWIDEKSTSNSSFKTIFRTIQGIDTAWKTTTITPADVGQTNNNNNNIENAIESDVQDDDQILVEEESKHEHSAMEGLEDSFDQDIKRIMMLNPTFMDEPVERECHGLDDNKSQWRGQGGFPTALKPFFEFEAIEDFDADKRSDLIGSQI